MIAEGRVGALIGAVSEMRLGRQRKHRPDTVCAATGYAI